MRVWNRFAIVTLVAGLAGPALALQAQQFQGSWRLPDGSCEAPFYQTSDLLKTSRDETAIKAVVTHEGKSVEGQLVLDGARRGQVVSPASDTAVFLVNSPGNGPSLIPLGPDVRGWPEVKLEKCPVTAP